MQIWHGITLVDYHCSSSVDPQPDIARNQFSSKIWDTTPPFFSRKIWDLGFKDLGSGITISQFWDYYTWGLKRFWMSEYLGNYFTLFLLQGMRHGFSQEF